MNRSFRALCASLLVLSVPASVLAKEPKTEDEKTFYFLGVMAGGGLTRFALTDEEMVWVQQGIGDVVTGDVADIDPQQYGPKLQAMMEARQLASVATEKKASAAFLEQEAAKPGVRKLDSGLLIEDIVVGTGKSPAVSDTVRVHYHGTLRDGRVFDSSLERGEPFETPLARVVECWQQGVSAMKQGGKARLICPSELAYGDSSPSPTIPGGSALVFEVELIEVVE